MVVVLGLTINVLEGQVVATEGQTACIAQQGVGMLEAVAVQVALLLPWLPLYVH